MEKNLLDRFRADPRLRVLQVVPTDDFQVYVYFSDGTIHLVDMKPTIATGTVFKPLQDPEFFKIRCTVMLGTLAWDISGDYDETRCVDLAPEWVYAFPEVPDPLESDVKYELAG